MEGGYEKKKHLQLKVEGFDPLCSHLVVNIGGCASSHEMVSPDDSQQNDERSNP